MLVAGHETTALGLTWAFSLLAQHPEAEAMLHAELKRVLSGRTPTLVDIPRLSYTDAVVAETLRLYPPAWSIGRAAVADCVVGQQPIPRGTTVLVSQWVTHRDARYFADPETFEPARWLDGRADHLPRFAYFPFGAGPRRCIGHAFATLEMVLALATLAQRFRLTLAPHQILEPRPAVTLRPKYPIRMTPHQRPPT
jgi:cytochrome P450